VVEVVAPADPVGVAAALANGYVTPHDDASGNGDGASGTVMADGAAAVASVPVKM